MPKKKTQKHAYRYDGDGIVCGIHPKIKKKSCNMNILTFYSTVPMADGIVSYRDMRGIYEQLFLWLEMDKGNFLVVKAKTHNDLKYLPDIEKKLYEYTTIRRAIIIYERAVLYPGLAADVVLSPTPTLVYMCAIYGIPTIFYDIHRIYKKYPFDLPNVSVVTDFSKIKDTICKICKILQKIKYCSCKIPETFNYKDDTDGKVKAKCVKCAKIIRSDILKNMGKKKRLVGWTRSKRNY